jgi:hypothetical protein
VDIVLRSAEFFVALAVVAFFAHTLMRADAGYELLALLVGLVSSAVILPIGAIVQFRRRKTESARVAMVFLFVALSLGWAVFWRAARAVD